MPSWRTVLVVVAPAAIVFVACANGLTTEPSGDSALGTDGGPGVDAGLGQDSGSQAGQDSGATDQDSGGGTTDSGPTCVTTPPSNKCGLVPQCGCAGSQTCDITDNDGGVTCVPGGGLAKLGNACTSTGQCGTGFSCVFGGCRPYCATTCTVTGTGACIQVEDGTKPIPNFKVCEINCSLIDPNACGGNDGAGITGCVPDPDGGTDCETAGTAVVNGVCDPSAATLAQVCGPALTCAVPQGQTTGTCKKWCRYPNVAGDCTSGTCGEFSPAVKVGAQEYGFCP